MKKLLQNNIYLLLVFLFCILLSCSSYKNSIHGTWKVSSGRNVDAIYEFTSNGRLYIYGNNGQGGPSAWYGWEVTSKKKSMNDLRSENETRYSAKLLQQGKYKWKMGKKIKFWPEVKTSEGEVTILNGPVYEFTEITKNKLSIQEWQFVMQLNGDSQLKPLGEMNLISLAYTQNPVNFGKDNHNKGVEYAIQGKFQEANEEFEKTLKVDPFHRPAEHIRFDGVYKSTTDDGGYFFRFFEDKTVLSVGTINGVTVAKLRKWFHKNSDKGVPTGVYSLRGGNIKFSTTGLMGTISYSGEVLNNKLTLKWFSQINKQTGIYIAEFIPFP